MNHYAILSGVCASSASLFGKLVGVDIPHTYYIFNIIFFILMILCNGGVWTLFVKALQASESSLTPTVISSAVNYLISALTGWIVFNEVTSILWWSGTTLVMIGLVLINSDDKGEKKVE